MSPQATPEKSPQDLIAAYKAILRDILDRRPSGMRQRLALDVLPEVPAAPEALEHRPAPEPLPAPPRNGRRRKAEPAADPS